MADYPKVYIVVLNWNNWRDTIECLESVYQSSYPNFQVICIDNYSTDESIEKIEDWASAKLAVKSDFVAFDTSRRPIQVVIYDRETAECGGDPRKEAIIGPINHERGRLILIKSGGNLGYAGGNNVGIRYVLERGDGAYVWILNNDTVVERNALDEMVETVKCDRSIGMAGSKIFYYKKPNILQTAGGCRLRPWSGNAVPIGHDREDNGQWDKPGEVDYISGASLLVKTEVIERIGLMDERFFLYWEDVDWGLRARRKKYRLLYCPESRVWHKDGGTSGGMNPVTDYYWTRNGLFFTRKFYPMLLPLIPFAYFIKYTLVRMLRRQPLNLTPFARGLRDFLKGKTGEDIRHGIAD
jgi:GT2 family glycosyltransferase